MYIYIHIIASPGPARAVLLLDWRISHHPGRACVCTTVSLTENSTLTFPR